ncbi:dTMP kinase [Elusimicrobiota bacterium]
MPKKKRKGSFIVLEGPDKSGKSTQAGLLVRALLENGMTVVHTREPGGSAVPLAEAIRSLVLDPAHRVHPLTELLLYEAARSQHTNELIVPALSKGAVVVSERYALATLAYQGFARHLPIALVRKLNRIATGGLTPDLTMILDIPDSEFRKRDPDRDYDRLERESAKFRREVAQAYRKLSRHEPRTVLLDAKRDASVIHVDIVRRVGRLLRQELTPVPY